jgi:microcystin-dependent protein
MKGDFSRSTFDRKKHYSRVLMQQGRVHLDADWNEHIDIEAHLRQTRARDMIGLSGAPQAGGGFQIAAEGSNLIISPGRIYVDGVLCENDVDVLFTDQPDLPKAALPSAPGIYLAYLDAWERHLTALEDERLREVALGGPEAATRTKIVWQVKLQRVGELNDSLISCSDFESWTPEGIAPTGTLAAQAATGATPDNNLYRAEVHDPGASYGWPRPGGFTAVDIKNSEDKRTVTIAQWTVDGCDWQSGQMVELFSSRTDKEKTAGILARITAVDAKKKTLTLDRDLSAIAADDAPRLRRIATFKWSRDNGSVVGRIEDIDLNGKVIKISLIGRLTETAFAPGQWVELSDEARALRGEPGVFVQLKDVQGNELTVMEWPTGSFTLNDLGSRPTVRRWDSPDGTIVITAEGYLPLEHGLQVKFSEGTYRSGDYWTFPARAITRDVEWPRNASGPVSQPPHGIEHHSCRLALVQIDNNSLSVKEDCREVFAPLTGQSTGSGVSRDVHQTAHGFHIGQAIYYDGDAKLYKLAQSHQETTTGMFLVSAKKDANHFTLLQAGYISGLSGLTPGEYYYVSDKTPGELTRDEPIGISNPILFADSATGGFVLPYRPSETSQELLKEYVDNLLVGSVAAFAMKNPPEGWRECNGDAIDRTVYARLFNKIGITFGEGNKQDTFNVPNLRGEFVRGWDRKGLIDSGRTLGSSQPDAFQNHGHNVNGSTGGTLPAVVIQELPYQAYAVYSMYPYGFQAHQHAAFTAHAHAVDINSAAAAIDVGYGAPRSNSKETRPRNVALLYCIKF